MSVELKRPSGEYKEIQEHEVPDLVENFKELARTDPVLRAAGQVDFEEVKKKLRKWVVVRREGGRFPEGHAIDGKRDENRRYETVLQLARAVMGEVASKPARKHEKELARQVYQNPYVREGLNSAVRAVYDKLQAHNNWEKIKAELAAVSSGEKRLGTYETHYNMQGRLDVLQSPEKYDLKRKICALHDMSEYLQNQTQLIPRTEGIDTVPVPRREAHYASKVLITPEGLYTGPVEQVEDFTRGRRNDDRALWTRNTDNEGTMSSAVTGTPVWAGLSMTTARMLEMVQWAGGGSKECECVAWAIFAFWQIDYDKRISPVHTFHEVFDVAKNYGVKYEPFFLPAAPPEPHELKAPLRRLAVISNHLRGHESGN
jgi:hypothetical protein